MLNQKQEFATGSGDHYDIRYGPKKDSTWKINFFSTTESAVLPLFLLPTTEVLQQSLGVKKASVLAITSAGQILDYAASLQANGILGRLDLTDFNHYQNLYVAYFLTQMVLANSNQQDLTDRLVQTNPIEILHLLQNEVVHLFPELVTCLSGSDIFLPNLAESLVYKEIGIPKFKEPVNQTEFSSHTFRHYFLNHPILTNALVDMILAGKIHFHQIPIEQFSNVGDDPYNLIYLSDVPPHLTNVEINRLLVMLENRLADCGMALDNGFGTNCLSIASGEAVWDNRFISAASKSSLQIVDDYYCWPWDNEKRVITQLGFKETSGEEWKKFRNQGPYGLPTRQDRPILLMKPYTATVLLPHYF